MDPASPILSMLCSLFSGLRRQRCDRERWVHYLVDLNATTKADSDWVRLHKLSELIHNSEGREDISSCSVEVWFREIIDLVRPIFLRHEIKEKQLITIPSYSLVQMPTMSFRTLRS